MCGYFDAAVAPYWSEIQGMVLREAGLIVSRRSGGHVIHTVTPPGIALLTSCRSMRREPFAD